MAIITYIEFNGEEHAIAVPAGTSVMRGAVQNAVPGIIGECGGVMSCGTCHVYVAPEWIPRLPERSLAEASLLEEVYDVQANSRLSCQITVNDELNGLVVRLPERQV